MKKIIVFAILILAVSAMANEYTGTVNDKPISIVFVPGPFGPGEQGDAVISYDGQKSEYDYSMTDKNGISVYKVIGLCDFVGNEQSIEAYQPLGVTLTRPSEFVKH
jgi:hypothetical protein